MWLTVKPVWMKRRDDTIPFLVPSQSPQWAMLVTGMRHSLLVCHTITAARSPSLLHGKFYPVCTVIKRESLDFDWNCIRAQVFYKQVQTWWQSMTLGQQAASPNKGQSYHTTPETEMQSFHQRQRLCHWTYHKSAFNVTITITKGGWFVPGNLPQPLAHGGTPYSKGHGEDNRTLTHSVRTQALLQAPFLAEKKPFEPQDLKWQASVILWSLPTATQEKAGWKVAGTWAEQGPPAAGTHQCEATKQGKVEEVCKANRVWTRAGEYHTCIPHHPTSTRKKETRRTEQKIHTWELPYAPCPAKHRETREKGSEKGSISDWNQQNQNFVQKKLTMIQPFQYQKPWNSKDRTCHSCWWHDSTYRTEKNQGKVTRGTTATTHLSYPQISRCGSEAARSSWAE